MTNIKNFDPSLLKIDQVSFENNDSVIYEIEYLKNLDSSNSLYLVFNNLDAQIEKSGENKYLIFASADKNEKALPLGKMLNIPVCIIIVRSVFEENGKYYPQVLLHECFYEYEKQNIINPPIV